MTPPERKRLEHMRNHWWWRPGWRLGRRLYTWHLTFDDQTVEQGRETLHQVVREYQARLSELPGLDLVPAKWLHITMQGLGFVDEVSAGEVQQIAAAVRRRCADLARLRLRLGPAVLDPEAIMLPVAPADAVRQLRTAMRAGIAEVWGVNRVPESASP
jgi:hypothetical protein